jgi:hypothetical protein
MIDSSQTVSLKEHFDDKFLAIEARLYRMEGKIDVLGEQDTTNRVELAKYGGVSAMVSAITAYLMNYIGKQ